MIELAGVRVPGALEGVDLALTPGERVVLLGGNGAGKSTLLRLLNGLVLPRSGRYTFEGRTVDRAAFRDRRWARRFRQRVVLLFQDPEVMLFNPTVREEIAFGPRRAGLEGVGRRVARWAECLEIQEHLDRCPLELSQGEKQRVCLAALLALEPEVLLLDEPTSSLDPRSTGLLIDLLAELPVTAVTATHNLSMAAELGERALVLGEDHRCLRDGATEQVLNEPATLMAANLVHSHRHHHGDLEHRHFHSHDWE